MTFNPLTQKVVIAENPGATTLGTLRHAWVRDWLAHALGESSLLPIHYGNTEHPTWGRKDYIWCDPNGATTADSEAGRGTIKLSLDGTNWIAGPSGAQLRQWWQAYCSVGAAAAPTFAFGDPATVALSTGGPPAIGVWQNVGQVSTTTSPIDGSSIPLYLYQRTA